MVDTVWDRASGLETTSSPFVDRVEPRRGLGSNACNCAAFEFRLGQFRDMLAFSGLDGGHFPRLTYNCW